jgi:ABC-type oligopeptide transport system substrate-binding subunit
VAGAAAYAAGELKEFSQVGASALDDGLLEFRLRSASPSFLFNFANSYLSGAQLVRGSGPFRFERLADDHLLVERDLRYQSRRGGNLGHVEWVHMEGNDAAEALQRGDVDIIVPGPNPEAWSALSDPQVSAVMGPFVALQYMIFLPESAGGPDIYVRKALAHAMDRRRVDPLLPNEMVASGGIVPPGLPGHTPDIAPRLDPDIARQYLRQSRHGTKLRLASIRSLAPRFWEHLLDGWRELLRIDIESVELSVANSVDIAGVADGVVDGYVADYPDPETFFGLLRAYNVWVEFTKAGAAEARRYGFKEVLDRALAARDGASRLALFHEADRLAVREECVVIPLTYARLAALQQPWVHGWWEWGPPFQSFDELTIDERSPRYRG